MSISAHRARIKTILDGVSDIGKVYDYLRLATERSVMLTLFQATIDSTAQIRTWAIDLVAWTADEPGLGRSADQTRIYAWEIHGWHGIDDSAATIKTFDTLAETVANAIDDDTTLNAIGLTLYRTPCQLALDYRMFANTLCRHAVITTTTAEIR